MTIGTAIKFYLHTEKWGELSNFAPFAITIDDKLWPTTEHYFQAQKFPSVPHYQEEIRTAHRPMIAAKMGRDRKYPLRQDWESVKDDVMYQALQAKFTQYDHLRALLLSTGKRQLIEHTTNDSYWGDGGDGKGKNKLGQLLMKLRDELQTTQTPYY